MAKIGKVRVVPFMRENPNTGRLERAFRAVAGELQSTGPTRDDALRNLVSFATIRGKLNRVIRN